MGTDALLRPGYRDGETELLYPIGSID